MWQSFLSFKNEVQFAVRQKILKDFKIRKKLPVVRPDPSEEVFYSKLIHSILPKQLCDSYSCVWDVGCRDWSYVNSLAKSFSNATLFGVEVDSSRRYWNFYRRQDYIESSAEALRKAGKNIQCFYKDFRNIYTIPKKENQNKAAFCFFFPFVSDDPCLSWGLPRHFVCFKELLIHTLKLADPKQILLFSSHQGEWEFQLARQAYEELNIKTKTQIIKSEEHFIPSQLLPAKVLTFSFPHDVYVIASFPDLR